MNNSTKPIKLIEDILGSKTFFFPDELSNERKQDTLEKCIFLRINGENHYIFTGKQVELTAQEYAVLRDSGMITSNYGYSDKPDFDPFSYEN